MAEITWTRVPHCSGYDQQQAMVRRGERTITLEIYRVPRAKLYGATIDRNPLTGKWTSMEKAKRAAELAIAGVLS